jgi:hypothetical protein
VLLTHLLTQAAAAYHMEADHPRSAALVKPTYDKDHDRHDLDREMSIARSKTIKLDPQGGKERRGNT